jgi:hypothetical protein
MPPLLIVINRLAGRPNAARAQSMMSKPSRLNRCKSRGLERIAASVAWREVRDSCSSEHETQARFPRRGANGPGKEPL